MSHSSAQRMLGRRARTHLQVIIKLLKPQPPNETEVHDDLRRQMRYHDKEACDVRVLRVGEKLNDANIAALGNDTATEFASTSHGTVYVSSQLFPSEPLLNLRGFFHRLYFGQSLFLALLDAVATMEVCACSLECWPIRSAAGHIGLLVAIGMNAVRGAAFTCQDAYGNPCNPWYRGVRQVVTLHSLRWLGHVLRMPAERLPYRALYTEATKSWVKTRGGQGTTWSRNTKTLTAPLSKVGRHCLPGWGPRDHSYRWLETLSEMA
ncbi:uncharacterized protein DEA37_0014934, partial [Paragonimus westermani]